MFFGLEVGAAIVFGGLVRHFCWPWERPVIIYRPAPPVVVERPVVVEQPPVVVE